MVLVWSGSVFYSYAYDSPVLNWTLRILYLITGYGQRSMTTMMNLCVRVGHSICECLWIQVYASDYTLAQKFLTILFGALKCLHSVSACYLWIRIKRTTSAPRRTELSSMILVATTKPMCLSQSLFSPHIFFFSSMHSGGDFGRRCCSGFLHKYFYQYAQFSMSLGAQILLLGGLTGVKKPLKCLINVFTKP